MRTTESDCLWWCLLLMKKTRVKMHTTRWKYNSNSAPCKILQKRTSKKKTFAWELEHQLKTFVAQVSCTIYCCIEFTIFKLNFFHWNPRCSLVCVSSELTFNVILKNIQFYRYFFFFLVLHKFDAMNAQQSTQNASTTGRNRKQNIITVGTRSDAKVFWKQKLKH